MNGHPVLSCPCKDCHQRRKDWQAKGVASLRSRHQNAAKYEPPANVERNPDPHGRGKDDVITRAKRLPKRTDMKPIKGF